MKKIKFTLYGLLIGAVCAAYGSAIFAFPVLLGSFRIDIYHANLSDVLRNFALVALFSAMFAVSPGAVGGAYLAWWLAQTERTPEEIRERGQIVGLEAGIVVSVFVVTVILRFNVDVTILIYAALAILVSTGMGWFGARLLAKDRKKFVSTNTRLERRAVLVCPEVEGQVH